MKKLILALLITTSMLFANPIPGDKAKHAFVGLSIYVGCFLVKGAIESAGYDTWLGEKTCLIPVVVAGVGKEVYDSQHDNHTAEVMDVVATVAVPFTLNYVIFEW